MYMQGEYSTQIQNNGLKGIFPNSKGYMTLNGLHAWTEYTVHISSLSHRSGPHNHHVSKAHKDKTMD